MSEPNPQDLLKEIEELKASLREHGEEYSVARMQKAALEKDYQKELGKTYIKLLSPTERAKLHLEKMPAEDMRKQIAHFLMGDVVWAAYLEEEAKVEALDKLIRTEQSRLTACQSELQFLSRELQSA